MAGSLKGLGKDVPDDGRHLPAHGREAIGPQLRDDLLPHGNDPPSTAGLRDQGLGDRTLVRIPDGS